MVLSKKTRKILLFSGIFVGVGLAVLILISVSFGDQITKIIVGKINDNLNTKISVKSASFSVFKRFPNAAVIFEDVTVFQNKDFVNNDSLTPKLIQCKNIFVEINLIKLLFKDYSIRRIVAQDGELNLFISEKGIENFDIFKKTSNLEGESSAVNLSGILLKNFRYTYFDVKHSVHMEGFINKAQLKGSIKKDIYDFAISVDLKSYKLLVNRIEYLKNRTLEGTLQLKRVANQLNLNTSEFKLNGIDFDLNMELFTGERSTIDLSTKVTDVSLSHFQTLIPDEYQKYFKDFESKGKANLALTVKGRTGGKYFPHIEMNFSLRNGTIKQRENNIKLTQVNCSGFYSNGLQNNSGSSIFTLNDFSSTLENGQITGSVTYKNFNSPTVSVDVKTLINLNDIRKFLSIDTIEILEGNLQAEISLKAGFVNNKSFSRENINNFQISGNANLSKGQLKLKNSNYLYNDVSSNIILGNDFQFESLSLKIDNNDFFIKGRLLDAVPYILKQTNTLNLKAELDSKNLDLTKYFEKDSKKTQPAKYDASVLFPKDLIAELNVNIGNFTLKKFKARNANAHVNYNPGAYTLNKAIFETMNGKVSGNGMVVEDENKNLLVKGQTTLKKIDIRQLFYVFENFGQSILRDNHLKGSLSGDILVSCDWNKNMIFNLNTVIVESNIEVTQGELINFEPLMGLSDFISLKELEDIKFSTLKNQIFIRHQQIIIPQMDINSSAFNISGSGVHQFDNHYTYRINVLLSEVLARKARQNKKENNEFGVIEDDGLGRTKIPLLIVGYKSDYKISYDTKGLKDIIKESMQSQKRELKSIFKEEFGMYKNDSTITKPKTTTKFKVEWDEKPTPKEETIVPQKTSKPKKKTFEEEEGYQIEFDN
jgi:hypothetical protein